MTGFFSGKDLFISLGFYSRMYIGIDLGTTNSLISGILDGKARVFRPADGGEALPSVIYIDKRGHRLYGRRAYDQAMIAPENVAMGFKRLMGTSTPIEIKGADMTLSPEECSAEIITQLLGQVSTEIGDDEKIEGAIIAIPAAFNQMQSEATLRAARLAGLQNVDLLQEPVAAALAAMIDTPKRSGKFLIYDFGGGTFDLALAEAVEGDVRILGQRGVNMLGGRDFDRMIVQNIVRPWLLANFDLPETFHRDAPYRRLIRVAQMAAEKAKIDLSTLDEASIFASDDEVRLMDQSESEIFLDVPITRAQFEELITPPIMQTIGVIRSLLEDTGTEPADVDRIVYVGGPSRIPLIRRLVSEELDIPSDLKTDPMTAIALGAAWYAEGRTWNGENAAKPKEEAEPLPEGLQGVALSQPKETQGSTQVPNEPDVSFDYTARTADSKTVVTVKVSAPLASARQISFSAKEWDSGKLPLTDGLTVMVPLPSSGAHVFDVHVWDDKDQPLTQHDSQITITRAVATASQIPAAQTIAVKTREDIASEENILLPLVTKGMALPASGQAKFRSGCTLRAGSTGALSFEIFQVEYPERIDLNLCVGVFRIEARDLPEGHTIKAGDPVVFNWAMTDGGILKATVRLPSAGIELPVPRFYTPQAGEVSYDAENGSLLARALLDHGDEEWGELAAALGPDVGPDVKLLKTRLQEQGEMLEEGDEEPESLRQIAEEVRFIRQDVMRASRKYAIPVLQRRLGRMNAVFNRMARRQAEKDDAARFDAEAAKIQAVIDADEAFTAYDEALPSFAEMRRIFFGAVWKNPAYVSAWFERLATESYLFPNREDFDAMVTEGRKAIDAKDDAALADVVQRLLAARITISATGMTDELATIIKAS